MFSPSVGKPKCSQAMSKVSFFYDSEKPRTLNIPNRIFFRKAGQISLKLTKPELYRENRKGLGSLLTVYAITNVAIFVGSIIVQ
jgi:hypothetical protein